MIALFFYTCQSVFLQINSRREPALSGVYEDFECLSNATQQCFGHSILYYHFRAIIRTLILTYLTYIQHFYECSQTFSSDIPWSHIRQYSSRHVIHRHFEFFHSLFRLWNIQTRDFHFVLFSVISDQALILAQPTDSLNKFPWQLACFLITCHKFILISLWITGQEAKYNMFTQRAKASCPFNPFEVMQNEIFFQ